MEFRMPRILFWNQSTLTIPLGGGRVRFFNPWTRRNVVAETGVLDLVDALVDGLDVDELKRRYLAAGPLALADVTEFTLWDNAYRNSDFCPEEARTIELGPADFEEFLETLTEAGLAAETAEPAFSYDKRGMADRFRGSFYEQIGTEGLFNRTVPTQWWTRQKFVEGGAALRETPYKYIQEFFLLDYFDQLQGLRVLDIGSGTGYFTAKMANKAAQVCGIDYDADYVAAAQTRYPRGKYPNLEFITADIIALESAQSNLAEMRFDRITMFDMLLFLFNQDYQSELWKQRTRVMTNVASLLEPDGLLLIMDPHPLWLTPWFGHDSAPFGILTEYRQRHFKVSPTLEEMSSLLHEAGLSIRRILEPDISDEFQEVNRKAYHFMRQIPQWWFIEAQKAPQGQG